MGMFDDIKHSDDRIACPAGHRLGVLQTKDFECYCELYVLEEGRLRRGAGHDDGPFPRATELQGDHTVTAYAFCEQCFPHLAAVRARHGGQLGTDYGPLHTFNLVFKNGRLTEVLRVVEDSND